MARSFIGTSSFDAHLSSKLHKVIKCLNVQGGAFFFGMFFHFFDFCFSDSAFAAFLLLPLFCFCCFSALAFLLLLFCFCCFCCFSAFAAFLLLLLFCFLCFCLSALCFCCFCCFGSCSPFSYCFCFSICLLSNLWIWCAAGAAPPPTPPHATKSALHLRHPRLPRNQYFKVNSPGHKLLTNHICLLCWFSFSLLFLC